MNRVQFAIDILKRHGRVTNAMVADTDQSRVYTFRNAVAEAKGELERMGYRVEHFYGKEWRDHGWELKPVSTGIQMDLAI